MCFSEKTSLYNFLILSFYAYNLQFTSNDSNIWKLFIPLYYLGIKDLLQYFLYKKSNDYIFSILSWVHICFQPLFVNMLISYFSNSSYQYWNIIYFISIIFGLFQLTTLDTFDIFNEGNFCKDKESDFCSDTNGAYQGNYHIAYKFKTKYKYTYFFLILMILPGLFTSSWFHSLLWLFFITLIKIIFNDLNVRDGERGSIWCFLSIIPTIPVVYYRSILLNMFSKNI